MYSQRLFDEFFTIKKLRDTLSITSKISNSIICLDLEEKSGHARLLMQWKEHKKKLTRRLEAEKSKILTNFGSFFIQLSNFLFCETMNDEHEKWARICWAGCWGSICVRFMFVLQSFERIACKRGNVKTPIELEHIFLEYIVLMLNLHTKQEQPWNEIVQALFYLQPNSIAMTHNQSWVATRDSSQSNMTLQSTSTFPPGDVVEASSKVLVLTRVISLSLRWREIFNFEFYKKTKYIKRKIKPSCAFPRKICCYSSIDLGERKTWELFIFYFSFEFASLSLSHHLCDSLTLVDVVQTNCWSVKRSLMMRTECIRESNCVLQFN